MRQERHHNSRIAGWGLCAAFCAGFWIWLVASPLSLLAVAAAAALVSLSAPGVRRFKRMGG